MFTSDQSEGPKYPRTNSAPKNSAIIFWFSKQLNDNLQNEDVLLKEEILNYETTLKYEDDFINEDNLN